MGRNAALELSALKVKSLRASPGFHFVGGVRGLALQVSGASASSWVLRVTIGGKRRDVGLGSYPDVSLQAARNAAQALRENIAEGRDPVEERRVARSTQAMANRSMTFEACCRSYIAAHEETWRNAKHAWQWQNTLENLAFPVLGAMPIESVGLQHVIQVLEPIWATKTETASRLRGRIESVLDWATARELREGPNPARWKGHLDKLLAAPRKLSKPKHYAALPLEALSPFMAALRLQKGSAAKALEFLVLTAARSGEVRGAQWNEFDLDRKLWTVPAERMKAHKEHRVPLAAPVLELLHAMPRDESGLVFSSPRGGALSDMSLVALMRRMKIDAVPHGFRSTFRDWASEHTQYPRDVAELALAHAIGNKVEAAYRRGDLLAKRAEMMKDWAALCTTAEDSSAS